MNAADKSAALRRVLDERPVWAVAVSGGVDSMVLAHVAAGRGAGRAVMYHAVSPAVPAAATARVGRHARAHDWDLRLIDAAETADPEYVANPADRCFHCKKNLYGSIAALTGAAVASGTNLDDLGDYRPGLRAAEHHGVRHPFVEAGIGKADIYALAAQMGLHDLAALPPQPCLASRIETGIPVLADRLNFVERVETELADLLSAAQALRCRVVAAGIWVECDPMPDPAQIAGISMRMTALCRREGAAYLGMRPYRRGSAFLIEAAS